MGALGAPVVGWAVGGVAAGVTSEANFADVPILALNPPSTLVLRDADYNFRQDDQLWLPLVASGLKPRIMPKAL